MPRPLHAALILLALLLSACSGKPPPNLGARDGQLSPCPSKPNCVSSQSQGKEHFVPPLGFSVPPDVTQRALLELLPQMEGAQVMTAESFYIRAEFTSPTMKFVDDVEFLIDPLSSIVHVRSASRLGYSDLGVNRKRVEEIRARLEKALEPATSA
jgi:uncharacterized protein (DUF1499 family)